MRSISGSRFVARSINRRKPAIRGRVRSRLRAGGTPETSSRSRDGTKFNGADALSQPALVANRPIYTWLYTWGTTQSVEAF